MKEVYLRVKSEETADGKGQVITIEQRDAKVRLEVKAKVFKDGIEFNAKGQGPISDIFHAIEGLQHRVSRSLKEGSEDDGQYRLFD